MLDSISYLKSQLYLSDMWFVVAPRMNIKNQKLNMCAQNRLDFVLII